MRATPVISSLALSGIPELLRREAGERVLGRVISTAGLDPERFEGERNFVPHAAVVAFLAAAARETGEERLGVLLAPHLSVLAYGIWGRHVLGAPTMGAAIARGCETLRFHSAGDRMSLHVAGDQAFWTYHFAVAGSPGYEQVAPAAAGVLLSLCRHYAPTGWRPLRIALDMPGRRGVEPYEDAFGCPVTFGAPVISIVMDAHDLGFGRRRRDRSPLVTLGDVVRARGRRAPSDPMDVLVEQIRCQVADGAVSLDRAARTMGKSVRGLQREMNAAGTGFRDLSNHLRACRAKELLRTDGVPVTTVAMELGYSSPANFARAFRAATGMTPGGFRLAAGAGAQSRRGTTSITSRAPARPRPE